MTGLKIAESMLGWQEVKQKHELMLFFKKHLKKGEGMLDPSTTPWCSRFVTCCERAAGNEGTGKDNARSYLDYGTPVKEEDAQPGDIVIFKRGNSNWQGHVTYFVDWLDDINAMVVLGGNQSDKVCKATYPQHNILGIRRP